MGIFTLVYIRREWLLLNDLGLMQLEVIQLTSGNGESAYVWF